MFLGWTPISTLRKSVITEEAAFLLFFICSRTRCSAVSPSESSASRFAPKRQKKMKNVVTLKSGLTSSTQNSD